MATTATDPAEKETANVSMTATTTATATATAEPKAEQSKSNVEIPKEVHSVYSKNQKRFIVLIASSAAFFSPLSSNIYLPALDVLSNALHVSEAQINLTVTTYLIFQAVSPMMIAGFSDNAGRRPAYIICGVLYIAANIGLALQNNYVALLILRALQSAGSSGTVSLCSGAIADVATSAERGSYLAYGSVSTILGPTLAPVIGGLLSQYLGWRAIFWFLTIFAGPVFILILIFLPETSHKVVGNGSYPPPHILNKSVTSWLLQKKWAKEGREIDPKRQAELAKNFKIRFPNPMASLVIVFTKGPGLLLFFNGLLLGVHYIVLSSIPFIFQELYGFNELKIALIYIPYGCGSVVSAFTTGKMANWNYRRHAKRLGFPLEKTKQLDLSYFPIEQARLEIAMPLLYFGCAMMIVYGWVLTIGPVSLAAPVILLFFIGWSIVAIYQTTAVLVIDIYPERPATATAANNLVRCMFGAGATAVVIPMLQRLGRGWTFTLAALLFVLFSPICIVLMRKGPQWRREMKAKSEAKKAKKAAEKQEQGPQQPENSAATGDASNADAATLTAKSSANDMAKVPATADQNEKAGGVGMVEAEAVQSVSELPAETVSEKTAENRKE